MKTFLQTINQTVACLVLSALTACGSPEQKFAITVTDESGKPLGGIDCTAGFNRNKTNGTGIAPYILSGQTDLDGKLELSGETVFFDTSVRCRRVGYYDSVIEKLWITGKNGDRWEPWPVEVNLVMKKVRNPMPMYAVRAHGQMRFRHPDPSMKKAYGFDLMVRDWVAPAGKGKIADMMIRLVPDNPDDEGFVEKDGVRIYHRREGSVEVSFPNPGDGIQKVNDPSGSRLLGPAVSPERGFLDHAEFPNTREQVTSSESGRICHIFRIRTIQDDSGGIKTAYYGKIEGGMLGTFSSRPYFRMTYYLNGKPKERTLEWDGKHNLFESLDRQYWPELY